MKITIVQGAFLPVPPIRGGAIEKIWKQLGEYFSNEGHSVIHVSRLCDGLPPLEIHNGVRHIRVRGADCPRSLILLKWLDLLYTIRASRILPKADILITNTFWAPIIFNPRRHGKIWVHVQRYPKNQFKFYGKASRIQSVSTPIANAISKQAPTLEQKVRVIPNPLPYPIPSLDLQKKDSKRILFVGRIHPEKGIDILIEAMALLKERIAGIHCTIVGPSELSHGGGGKCYRKSLDKSIASLKSPVTFEGPVYDEDALKNYYASAAVFVYPSLAGKGEASPVAPLEAMAGGCPVIVSDLECFDDALGKGSHVQRFQHRGVNAASALADCIAYWMHNESRRKEASIRAYNRAKQFSLSSVGSSYLDELESLIQES